MRCKQLKKLLLLRSIKTKELAEMIGIPNAILFLKMRGLIQFKAWEILKIAEVIELTRREIEQIFFEEKFPKGNKKGPEGLI